jgi:MerR family transcriptional regulator, light-induced transcriptional regulator
VTGAELPAGAVARRLGVAVTTLRTWHQRYGLGPSGHAAGLHRRYTEEDIARLDAVRRLTARGVPTAEAARRALVSRRPDIVAPQRRDGGGSTIPVGRAGPAARGLARASSRLDSTMMLATISAALAVNGVVDTWNAVLRPVLTGIGDRHADTGRFVEVEHLLSRCVSEALARVPRPPAALPARILLAAAPEEQHILPLEALAAALAERSTPCRLLGARVPAPALAAAVDRTGPAVVFVWSHTPATADPAPLIRLGHARARPAVVAAVGPGWDGVVLPDCVDRPATLDQALALALAGADD